MPRLAPLRFRTRRISRASLRRTRAGFSLLEVLVASGILVFALAGIAAILPAAGSIVSDGVAQDRAGLLAANVLAELRSRDLLRASAYASGTSWPKSTVLGVMGGPSALTTGTFFSAPLVSGTSPAGYDYGGNPLFGGTIFNTAWPYRNTTVPADNPNNYRGFFLEDDLSIDTSGAAPAFAYEVGNAYVGTAIGPRGFKRGASWGVMVTPTNGSPLPGDTAILSIATFKKPGDVAPVVLRIASSNILTLAPGNDTVLKTYLPAGSFFLAIPPTPPAAAKWPSWFRVNSSWTAQSGTSFVMVNDGTLPLANYETTAGSGVMQAVGFSALIRVDQFPVTLK